MRYPQSFMDALKSRFTVSQVVGRRVSLRRHGREFMGLCPFHKEKTPSFTVNDEKGFYHCFGCGAHGDIISFIKDFEGISYKEAIERLAGEAGLAVPQPSREEAARERVRHSLQDACEAACRWFMEQYQVGSHASARHYVQQRGLSEEIIQRFRIGYAPESRDALKQTLMAEGFAEELLVEAGLLIRPDQGKPTYSRFRGRVMFPIRDARSKVVAFGGRILPDAAQGDAPKYLNSPETDLFKKGHLLYNMDLARRAAMDTGKLLLCEGYMDVIALAQAGIAYAVAPLGTAVTETQMQLLWQMCDTPAMCLDGDSAGVRAMRRASELALPLLSPGKSLHFVRLPAGQDPDDVVRQGGAQALLDMVQSAPGLADMLWQEVAAADAKTPEERAGAEHKLMQMADAIQNPIVKAHYRSYFKDKFWSRGEYGAMRAKSVKAAREILPLLPQAQDQRSQMRKAMMQCCKLVLLYPSLLHDLTALEEFSRMECNDATLMALAGQVIAAVDASAQPTRETVQAELDAVGLQAEIQRLWATDMLTIPKALLRDTSLHQLPMAQRLWRQAANAYQLAAMQAELIQAEFDLAQQMSEASFERIRELKADVTRIEREREQLYMEDEQEHG